MRAQTIDRVTLMAIISIGFLSADNLFLNSSFELGDKGWSGQRVVKIRQDGKWDYPGPGWSLDTSTSKFGTVCARLDVPEDNEAKLSSHEIYANSGKTLVVSFWAKSSKAKYPIEAMFMSVMGGGSNVDIQRVKGDFLLNSEWARYSFSFQNEKSRYFYLSVSAGNKGAEVLHSPGIVWIDGLQVEEGALTEYGPASQMEAAVYTSEMIVVPDKIKGKVVILSYGTSQKNTRINLTLKNNFFKRTEGSQNMVFDLEPGKPQNKAFEFDHDVMGPFDVFTSLQPGLADGAVFLSNEFLPLATQCPPEDKSGQSAAKLVRVFPPTSAKNGFKIGLVQPLDGTKNSGLPFSFFNDSLGAAEQIADRTRLAGALLSREWDDNYLGMWSELEPEQGEFKWERADRIVSLARSKGIDLVVCLPGRIMKSGERWQIPEWVRKRDRLGNPEGTNGTFGWRKSGYRLILPQIKDFRNLVRAVAERYKGKIPYYEIFNEPNWYLSPEYYLEYLQAAFEEIRKADPDAKVVGICSTSDDGANQSGFIEDCLKLGAAKYCDIITFHPYLARTDDSKPFTSMAGRREALGILRKYGVTHPLWNGEMYYPISSLYRYYHFNTVDFTADAICRGYIVDMGEGIGTSFPLGYRQLFKNNYLPNTYFSESRSAGNVGDKFAANSVSGFFLNGAVPLKTIEDSEGLLCYIFKNEKKLLSALWSTREPFEATLPIPPGASLIVRDIFGNILEKEKGKPLLSLTRVPQWIEWMHAEESQVVVAMESIKKRKKK